MSCMSWEFLGWRRFERDRWGTTDTISTPPGVGWWLSGISRNTSHTFYTFYTTYTSLAAKYISGVINRVPICAGLLHPPSDASARISSIAPMPPQSHTSVYAPGRKILCCTSKVLKGQALSILLLMHPFFMICTLCCCFTCTQTGVSRFTWSSEVFMFHRWISIFRLSIGPTLITHDLMPLALNINRTGNMVTPWSVSFNPAFVEKKDATKYSLLLVISAGLPSCSSTFSSL